MPFHRAATSCSHVTDVLVAARDQCSVCPTCRTYTTSKHTLCYYEARSLSPVGHLVQIPQPAQPLQICAVKLSFHRIYPRASVAHVVHTHFSCTFHYISTLQASGTTLSDQSSNFDASRCKICISKLPPQLETTY